jgi:hypothetical protein
MTSDLPSVACSCVLSEELDGRGGITGSAGGVNERCGSGLGVGVGVGVGVFVGFHMIGSKSFLHGSLGEAPVLPNRSFQQLYAGSAGWARRFSIYRAARTHCTGWLAM